MSAATFTTLVTSYCEKLGAASDVAELDALDLTLDSDYPRFRKKDFDELMAKCKVEVARDNFEVCNRARGQVPSSSGTIESAVRLEVR